MDNNSKNKGVVEDIRDLVETANEWMEEAQEAIDDKKSTKEDLHSLYVEGVDIPVEMDLLKVLETEIKRRDWAARATKCLTEEPYEDIETLQDMFAEIPTIRALLPENIVAEEYQIEKEKEMRNTIKSCLEWLERTELALKAPGKGAPKKNQVSVTIDSLLILIEEGDDITVDIEDELEKLKQLKNDSVALLNTVIEIVENIGCIIK